MKGDKSHYKEKYPAGTRPDPAIAEAVGKRLLETTISCADAEDIALKLHKTMPEVGAVIDLLEAQIKKCQLGIFGYQPRHKILAPAKTIVPEIETAIRGRLIEGRLSCAAVWEIAAAFAQPRMNIAALCEALGIKIRPCQLGAF